MSTPAPEDISQWVRQAPDSTHAELRQAVHTILAAIAQDPHLRESMVMKGGILLAIQYHSVRFTRDIDFSTPLKRAQVNPGDVRTRIDNALRLMVESLDYDLDCKVQSCKINPPGPDATCPSIDLKIG